jgi:hypothetical protein
MSGLPADSIWQLPDVRAVYALYGAAGEERRSVFVGIAESLLERLVEQLLIPNLRARSPSTVLFIHPGYVREIHWWEHPRFAATEALRAAEFVASDVLLPLLSSRRPSSRAAGTLYEDERFREEMTALFCGDPSGQLVLPTLDQLLERLARIEERLDGDGGPGTGAGRSE